MSEPHVWTHYHAARAARGAYALSERTRMLLSGATHGPRGPVLADGRTPKAFVVTELVRRRGVCGRVEIAEALRDAGWRERGWSTHDTFISGLVRQRLIEPLPTDEGIVYRLGPGVKTDDT